MPKAEGTDGAIHLVENELVAFQVDRLGLGQNFDRAAQHDSRCLRWRETVQVGGDATQGHVCGIDYSEDSVAVSQKTNARWIDIGRVEIRQGTVSQLPFPDDVFDLVTAVETHYFWPDLAADTREVFRVLRPGGAFIVIAEAYKGAKTAAGKLAEKYLPLAGMALLSVDEHRELFTTAGYSHVGLLRKPARMDLRHREKTHGRFGLR